MKTKITETSNLPRVLSWFTLSIIVGVLSFKSHGQTGPAGVNSGILTWLDGSDVDADGNPNNNPTMDALISTWKDKSGNSNNATHYSDPFNNTGVYNTSGINGNPVVTFSGSVYEFTGIDIRAISLPDVTVIAVYKQGSVNRSGIWGNDNGGWDRFMYTRFNNSDGIISRDPSLNPPYIDIPNAGVPNSVNIITGIYDGAVTLGVNFGPANGSSCYLNGNLISTFTDMTAASNAKSNLRLGWDGNDGMFNGDIAEFIVYDRILNSCELSAINTYLATKYQISLVTSAPSPNVITGNSVINTQTEMDAFFNTGNGNKWTKVDGNLTINGNSNTDPITSFCNLNELTEVTGHLLIQQFTKSGNPSNLWNLGALAKTGRLTIITCPKFESIALMSLTDVAGSLIVRNNINTKNILMPVLATVGGSQFMINRNHRAESIRFSNSAGSFTLTNATESTSVDIQSNGDSASNALNMDFNKITAVARNFTFANNKNTGVSNFDNIFSGLSTVGGNMVITNNTSLNKCCIAYNTAVSGSTTISGNLGDCADLGAVTADCGQFNKKQRISQKSNTDLFSQLSIYPSPNKGKFEVELTTIQTGILNITVTDLMGRTVLTQSQNVAGTEAIPVNMDKATAGQYILKLELNGNVVVKRVQVVK